MRAFNCFCDTKRWRIILRAMMILTIIGATLGDAYNNNNNNNNRTFDIGNQVYNSTKQLSKIDERQNWTFSHVSTSPSSPSSPSSSSSSSSASSKTPIIIENKDKNNDDDDKDNNNNNNNNNNERSKKPIPETRTTYIIDSDSTGSDEDNLGGSLATSPPIPPITIATVRAIDASMKSSRSELSTSASNQRPNKYSEHHQNSRLNPADASNENATKKMKPKKQQQANNHRQHHHHRHRSQQTLASRANDATIESVPDQAALPAEHTCVIGDVCMRNGKLGYCYKPHAPIAYERDATETEDFYDMLHENCAHFFDADENLRHPLCCSPEQEETIARLNANIDLIRRSCPSCLVNVKKLFCNLFCAPNQRDFVRVDRVKGETVIEVTYAISARFVQAFFASCRDVRVFGAYLLDFEYGCGKAKRANCTAIQFMHVLGGLSEIPFNFRPLIIVDDERESNTFAEVPKSDHDAAAAAVVDDGGDDRDGQVHHHDDDDEHDTRMINVSPPIRSGRRSRGQAATIGGKVRHDEWPRATMNDTAYRCDQAPPNMSPCQCDHCPRVCMAPNLMQKHYQQQQQQQQQQQKHRQLPHNSRSSIDRTQQKAEANDRPTASAASSLDHHHQFHDATFIPKRLMLQLIFAMISVIFINVD